jgi:hypothetical protein
MGSSASEHLSHPSESCQKPGIVKTPVLANASATFCNMDFAQCTVLSGSLRELEIMDGDFQNSSLKVPLKGSFAIGSIDPSGNVYHLRDLLWPSSIVPKGICYIWIIEK